MTAVVRSELLKLRTTRLWWGLLIGVVVSSGLFALFIGLAAGRGPQAGGLPGLEDPATLRSTYTAGLQVAYLFALAVGIIAISGETRHQTITSTFLATPHRARVILAKVTALLVVGIGYGVAAVVSGVVLGGTAVALRGYDLRLLEAGIPRSLVLAVLAVALWTLFGLGVGTLIRNQVAALLVAIGLAWIVEPLLSLLLNAVHVGQVARFLPSSATSAMVSTVTSANGISYEYLPWWGGALVLVAYATAFALLGTVLTVRRDVT